MGLVYIYLHLIYFYGKCSEIILEGGSPYIFTVKCIGVLVWEFPALCSFFGVCPPNVNLELVHLAKKNNSTAS